MFRNSLFGGVVYSIYKQKGVPEPVPDSFPGSSQTSLSSVWFEGATPDLADLRLLICRYSTEFGKYVARNSLGTS